ncbi:hypothetical protein KW794_01855 [Candidatus Saccharibacteria bacterium]|nr:hypothetical protein [Candidatus Saccharibacteria bacterium]
MVSKITQVVVLGLSAWSILQIGASSQHSETDRYKPNTGQRIVAQIDQAGHPTAKNCYHSSKERSGYGPVEVVASYWVYQQTVVCDANHNGLIDFRYTVSWTATSGICSTNQSASGWRVSGGIGSRRLVERSGAEFHCQATPIIGEGTKTCTIEQRWFLPGPNRGTYTKSDTC